MALGGLKQYDPKMESAAGARDRAGPNFMALASFGLEIGVFRDFLVYSVLPPTAILGLDRISGSTCTPNASSRFPLDGHNGCGYHTRCGRLVETSRW